MAMQDNNKNVEYRLKIVVVGNLGTGKTSFIRRYVHQRWNESYKPTVGVDFALQIIQINENTKVHLQLWDIAGQERFGSMTPIYYKNASGAIIVFDLTDITTFKAVEKWKNDLKDKLLNYSEDSIPILLVGNKNDLITEGSSNGVTDQDIEEYLNKQGNEETTNFAGFFRVSAKTSDNVHEAVDTLVKRILEKARPINTKNSFPEQKKTEEGCCFD